MHKGRETMQIGVEWNERRPREPQQARLEAFVALLKAGGSDYELVPDIQQWRWKVSYRVGASRKGSADLYCFSQKTIWCAEVFLSLLCSFTHSRIALGTPYGTLLPPQRFATPRCAPPPPDSPSPN